MNDALLGVFALVLLIGVSYTLTRLRARQTTPWRVRIRPHDNIIEVRCVHPGEEPVVIGQLSPAVPDRGLRLAELRAEAEEACVELNASRTRE